MSNAQLETAIEAAWEARDTITPATGGETREAILNTLNALDSGVLRVAERQENGSWHVNQWAKKAVLLGFRLKDMEQQEGGAQGGGWWDKVDSKFKGWGDNEWGAAGFRAERLDEVPAAIEAALACGKPAVVDVAVDSNGVAVATMPPNALTSDSKANISAGLCVFSLGIRSLWRPCRPRAK